MKSNKAGGIVEKPLLYYRTDEEIAAYREKPVEEKLAWL
jgi:hypothetical protein